MKRIVLISIVSVIVICVTFFILAGEGEKVNDPAITTESKWTKTYPVTTDPNFWRTPEIEADTCIYSYTEGDNIDINECIKHINGKDNIWIPDIDIEYNIIRLTTHDPIGIFDFMGGDPYGDAPSNGYCYVINYKDKNNMLCEAKIYITNNVSSAHKYEHSDTMTVGTGKKQKTYKYYDSVRENGIIQRSVSLSDDDNGSVSFRYYNPEKFDTSILESNMVKKCERDDFVYYGISGENLDIEECLSTNKIRLNYSNNVWIPDIKNEYRILNSRAFNPAGYVGGNIGGWIDTPEYSYHIRYIGENDIACDAKIYIKQKSSDMDINKYFKDTLSVGTGTNVKTYKCYDAVREDEYERALREILLDESGEFYVYMYQSSYGELDTSILESNVIRKEG